MNQRSLTTLKAMISFWFQDSLFSLRVHIPVSLQSRYLNGLHFLHWGRWTPVHVRSVHFCDLQVAWVALLWSDKYCYSSCDPVFNTNSVATLCRQLQEKQALGIFSVESSLAKTKFTFCQKKAFDKVFACLSQYSLLLRLLLTFVQLLESFRCNRLQVGLIWNGATLRRGGCTRRNLPRLWQGCTRLKAPFSLFTRTQKVTEISRIQVPVCFR